MSTRTSSDGSTVIFPIDPNLSASTTVIHIILPVTTGVSQGSVYLDQYCLYITYINHVTSVISSNSELKLFADDITLYREIQCAYDYQQLQTDDDAVTSFIARKHLLLKKPRCLYQGKDSVPQLCLTVNNKPLLQVFKYKYLGVTITSNLSWNPHISNICNRTRRIIGMLYRKFYKNSNPSTRSVKAVTIFH